MTIIEYGSRIKEIVHQLASVAKYVNEEDQVHSTLNDLDYNYDIVLATT